MVKHISNYNFSEFLEIAENGKPTIEISKRSSRKTDDFHFYNSSNFNEGLRLAKFGWKDSFKMVQLSNDLDKLIPVSQFKESFVYDVSGSYPDVGKYLTGEPENMVQFITEEDQKKISVIINGGVSWSIDQKIQFNKGAAIVSLVSKLEDLGYRVEVTLLYCSESMVNDNVRHDSFIKIKEYHEQIDIDRFAFIFCNVAFNRRIKFSVNECLPIAKEMGYYKNGSYGRVSDLCKSDTDILNSYDINLLERLVPETTYQFSTLEKSAEYVVRTINEYLEKQKERV
jgi:hypothetical protein